VSSSVDPDGWVARWDEGRIGFHRPTVQPWLVEHAAQLAPRGDECVLVPLCGKSVDLAWLEARGHAVVGVDVAEKGLRAFLAEHGRRFAEHDSPPFRVFATGRIELWRGDFFELDPARHGTFPAILDRAALIALPRERRADYARRLVELLAPRGRLLLIGLEYDEREMAGPPYAVSRREAAALFGEECATQELGRKAVLDEEPRFKERGLTALHEYALLLTRRAPA
jgi:thiopurine S-methyltransferase